MKVQNNHTYYVGNDPNRIEQNNGENKKTGTNASYMMKQTDPMALKREQAKKKAMGLIGDAFAADRKIDEGQDERRELINKLKQDVSDNQNQINSIEADREALRVKSGISKDSDKERELKLLEREAESKFKGANVTLTAEEQKEIDAIKARGLTDYQAQSLEMKESEKYYSDAVFDAKNQIGANGRAIRMTENERLKSHAMIDAHKEADEIMIQASKEAVQMAVDEAKEKLDKEAEEKREAAKEKKEEEEALEERIEARRGERKEREERAEDISDMQENVLVHADMVDDAQQEIKDMMNKMKLLDEDLKGAAVDKQI